MLVFLFPNRWIPLIVSRQPRVQLHLKNVYTCLVLSTACAAAGVYLSISGWFNYPLLALIGSVITMVWLFSLDFNRENQMTCFGLMSITALLTGIHISPLVNLAVNVNPELVMSAFLYTSVVFLCFTLSALFTSKRTYLYLGGNEHQLRIDFNSCVDFL